MNEVLTVTINNIEIPIREYEGKRVVTCADIDRVHERPEGTARKRFNDNRKRFVEGEDYFKISPSVFRTEIGEMDLRQQNDVTLFTESGYLMLVKSFKDDLAWQVQRQLVNNYFESKQIKPVQYDPHVPLSREELAAYMLYTDRHTDAIEKMMSEFIDNQTAIQNNAYNSMMQTVSSFTESALVIMNTMKTISESMVATMNAMSTLPFGQDALPNQNVNIEEEQWKQKAYEKANRIAKECGNRNGNTIFMKLYNLIKINDGIDLNKYKNDYMKKHHISSMSIISCISSNKELRKLFDKYADEYLENIINERKREKIDKEKKMPISLLAQRVPECVLSEIAPLTEKYGHKSSHMLRVIYRKMENLSGLNLDNLRVLYAEKNHLSSVSKAYLIGHDEKLMRLLKNAVSALLEEGIK